MLFSMFYYCTFIPYRIAFLDEVSDFNVGLDILIDMFFIADIVITFFMPYEIENGKYETDLKKITKNYVRGNFIIDVLATFPFELLAPS